MKKLNKLSAGGIGDFGLDFRLEKTKHAARKTMFEVVSTCGLLCWEGILRYSWQNSFGHHAV